MWEAEKKILFLYMERIETLIKLKIMEKYKMSSDHLIAAFEEMQ